MLPDDTQHKTTNSSQALVLKAWKSKR